MRIDPFTRLVCYRPGTKTNSGLALAISWGDSGPKKLLTMMLALISLAFLTLPAAQSQAKDSPAVSVIVRHAEGAGQEARETIRDLGGVIVRRLGIISSFEAKLPANKVALLDHEPSVASVTPNTAVQLLDYREATIGHATTRDSTTTVTARRLRSHD